MYNLHITDVTDLLSVVDEKLRILADAHARVFELRTKLMAIIDGYKTGQQGRASDSRTERELRDDDGATEQPDGGAGRRDADYPSNAAIRETVDSWPSVSTRPCDQDD